MKKTLIQLMQGSYPKQTYTPENFNWMFIIISLIKEENIHTYIILWSYPKYLYITIIHTPTSHSIILCSLVELIKRVRTKGRLRWRSSACKEGHRGGAGRIRRADGPVATPASSRSPISSTVGSEPASWTHTPPPPLSLLNHRAQRRVSRTLSCFLHKSQVSTMFFLLQPHAPSIYRPPTLFILFLYSNI